MDVSALHCLVQSELDSIISGGVKHGYIQLILCVYPSFNIYFSFCTLLPV